MPRAAGEEAITAPSDVVLVDKKGKWKNKDGKWDNGRHWDGKWKKHGKWDRGRNYGHYRQ